jgi:pimeloyl-ACP methyl ester carboxylesterase
VVLLHGVGFGPATLAPVATVLAGEARVVVVRRPAARPGATLEDQAAEVARLLDQHIPAGDVVVAGVSGGATLALALALGAFGDRIRSLVVHEPLLGSHAPTLHAAVVASRAALAAGTTTPAEWFRSLAGGPHRALAGADPHDLLAEVTPFVAWDPAATDLAALGSRHLATTVGTTSGAPRREAAAALAATAGAEIAFVRGGHLVQFDDPEGFAAHVLRAVAEP